MLTRCEFNGTSAPHQSVGDLLVRALGTRLRITVVNLKLSRQQVIRLPTSCTLGQHEEWPVRMMRPSWELLMLAGSAVR